MFELTARRFRFAAWRGTPSGLLPARHEAAHFSALWNLTKVHRVASSIPTVTPHCADDVGRRHTRGTAWAPARSIDEMPVRSDAYRASRDETVNHMAGVAAAPPRLKNRKAFRGEYARAGARDCEKLDESGYECAASGDIRSIGIAACTPSCWSCTCLAPFSGGDSYLHTPETGTVPQG